MRGDGISHVRQRLHVGITRDLHGTLAPIRFPDQVGFLDFQDFAGNVLAGDRSVQAEVVANLVPDAGFDLRTSSEDSALAISGKQTIMAVITLIVIPVRIAFSLHGYLDIAVLIVGLWREGSPVYIAHFRQ